MMHIAPLIILSIVSALGVIGNLFIIGSICLYPRLRVRGNAFLVNLAIADLIIVGYIMPVGLASSQYEQNPFGDIMCEINAFLTMTSCGVSTQSLMFIALERYFHICKMHLYRKAFSPKLIALYIFLIWIYTAAWTCQGWTGWTTYKYAESAYICIFSAPSAVSYAITLSIFGMLLPMIVLGVCYYKIFITVFRSRRAVSAYKKKGKGKKSDTSQLTRPEADKQNAREYQLVLTLFTIVVVFVVFWLPACVVLALSPIDTFPTLAFTISIWMAMSNSSMNSFVYGILNKNFRAGYKQLLRQLLCCFLYSDSSGCGNCKALLDEKEDSSSSESRNYLAKGSKSSVAPCSLTEPTIAKSAGPDPEIMEAIPECGTTGNEHNMNHKPPTGRSHLQPLQYDEEPTSGAPIKAKIRHEVFSLNERPQGDHVLEGHSQRSPFINISDGFFSNSTVGSQSSLIQRSSNYSEVSSLASTSYQNKMGTGITDVPPGSVIKNKGPPASAARQRPNSQSRELSVTSLVMETKL